jgi:hypothetical protein
MPLDYAFHLPDYYFSIPERERATRARIVPQSNPDFCEIDGEHSFIRGVLRIPVLGTEDHFCWGVWTTLSAANFARVRTTWHDMDPPLFEPMFGWLANHIPIYPETLSLKANVILQKNIRPFIELQEAGHPLAKEQHSGISMNRVQEMLHQLGAI